jgi:hypothetical protein
METIISILGGLFILLLIGACIQWFFNSLKKQELQSKAEAERYSEQLRKEEEARRQKNQMIWSDDDAKEWPSNQTRIR